MDPIINSIISLSPSLTNSIIKFFSLDSSYSLGINPLIIEIIKYISFYSEKKIIIFIFTFLIFLLILKKLNFLNFLFKNDRFNIFKRFIKTRKNLFFEAYIDEEKYLYSSNSFNAANNYLIDKYKLLNTKILNNKKIIIDVKDFNLENDLYLNVESKVIDKKISININLYTFYRDIKLIEKEIMDNYSDDRYKYKLVLTGKETKNSYDYSEIMLIITSILINKYKINKLKILNMEINKDDISDKKYKKNNFITNKEKKINNIMKLNKSLDDTYLLEDCENYMLENDIFLTIERSKDIVSYKFFSSSVDIRKFIKGCFDYHILHIKSSGFKNSIKYIGVENYRDSCNRINYPEIIFAINHYLLKRIKLKYIILEDFYTCKDVKILEDINNVFYKGINFSIISKKKINNLITKKIYLLESNKINLKKFEKKCLKEYKDYKESLIKDDIYYFKYLGIEGSKTKTFSKRILYSKEIKIYEGFEHIFNEHKEMLKKDIDTLKDIDYYIRTGSRRKKSYLFYGEPGCGKNTSVLAMALYDKRHIIDVPLSILQYCNEFDEIMNINEINGIKINMNKVIFMFDEMDEGLNKIISGDIRYLNKLKDLKNNKLYEKNGEINDLLSKLNINLDNVKDNKLDNKYYNSLNLSSLLSQFDGISNYNGVIYVGLTNNIEKIPDQIKRSLRLTPIYFTYMRRCDVIDLIEKMYEVKIDPLLIDTIPDRKLIPSELKFKIENFKNYKDLLLDIIKD